MSKAGRAYLILGLTLSLLVIVLYYFFFIAPFPNQRLLTADLPSVDRAQIEAVDSGGSEEVKTVLALRDLVGTDAQSFASLWRSQWYGYYLSQQVMCHFPAYRVRFFKAKTLLVEATICFHCNNIYLLKSDLLPEKISYSVGISDLRSQRMQTYLSSLFPGIKREKLPF